MHSVHGRRYGNIFLESHTTEKERCRRNLRGCLIPMVVRYVPNLVTLRINHVSQVYTLGCSSSIIFHFQLDETTGDIASTANYTADSSIVGSQSGGIFVARAFELAVMVARSDSDEVGVALV